MYKEINQDEFVNIVNDIDNTVPLKNLMKLHEGYRVKNHRLYLCQEQRHGISLLWWLTVPALLLLVLLLKLLSPLNWLFTGSFYYDRESPMSRLALKWLNKL